MRLPPASLAPRSDRRAGPLRRHAVRPRDRDGIGRRARARSRAARTGGTGLVARAGRVLRQPAPRTSLADRHAFGTLSLPTRAHVLDTIASGRRMGAP